MNDHTAARAPNLTAFTWREIVPANHLTRFDYAFAAASFACCFVFFFQWEDLPIIGSFSLNFLFGKPLEFYENCVHYHSDSMNPCGYPPTAYALFALWLLPLKALGIVTTPAAFPIHVTYWLKLLTSLFYVSSALVFRKIALQYSSDIDWARYASTLWFVMPLAVFSQFVFSQIDVFYVFMTLVGFLLMTRQRLYLGSLCFGVAITFKYFPAFVFIPLLLLIEKRVSKLAIHLLIFSGPLVAINLLYHSSPAYASAVNGYHEINGVYAAVFDVGLQFYGLFIAFTVLCGIAYFTSKAGIARLKCMAYLWLVSSILPYLLMWWGPEWLIFVTPPIVLTSMLSARLKQFMLLDLLGMVAFVAAISVLYVMGVDSAMFRGDIVGVDLRYTFLMRDLFGLFGSHSQGVYISAFLGYLILQIVLKYHEFLRSDVMVTQDVLKLNYGRLRSYFLFSLMSFILPVSTVIAVDMSSDIFFIDNIEVPYQRALTGKVIEQTFLAKGDELRRVAFPWIASNKPYYGSLLVELLDDKGTTLASLQRPVAGVADQPWPTFSFAPTHVTSGAQYAVRLTRLGDDRGSNISLVTPREGGHLHGRAIVDGIPDTAEIALRIGFTRSLETRGSDPGDTHVTDRHIGATR